MQITKLQIHHHDRHHPVEWAVGLQAGAFVPALKPTTQHQPR